MKTIFTIASLLFVTLIFGQSQISISSNGNYLKVFVDGNLQNQTAKTYLKVLNIPEGQHTVSIQYSNNNYMQSSQSMYLIAHKSYKFNIRTVNSRPQLVLTSMGQDSHMSANGSNVVNFSTNQIGSNHLGTLNPHCTCGHCYGNTLACQNNNGGSIHIDFSNTNGQNSGTCTCHPQFPTSNVYFCGLHHPQATQHYNGNMNQGTQSGVHPQMLGYSGNVGCYKTRISKSDFLAAIRKETFRDDKIAAVKMALKYNSIAVDDLAAGIKEFSFDDDKLTVAKIAYDKVIDLNNYYKLGSIFSYSSTKTDFKTFLESK